MTEVDVMNDLMFCEHKDCENCHREKSATCINALMRDARSVIKSQRESLGGVKDTINRLNEKITDLQNAVKHNYEKKKLVEVVNEVIQAFGDDEYWCEEEHYDTVDLQVDALKNLLNLIGWENCKIVIEEWADYPMIQYKE